MTNGGSPICGGAAPPVVNILWQGIAAGGEVQALSEPVVVATITNVSPFAVILSDVRAMGDASGVPFSVAEVHAPFSLEPGASEPVSVDLVEHVDLTKMPSAGAVEVFARVSTVDAWLLEHAASQTLFFDPAGDGLEVYDAEGLRSAKNAGDVADSATDLVGPKTRRLIVFPTPAGVEEEGA
jgi:hypothetical protein